MTKPKRRTQGMHWIRDEKRLAIYMRDGMACIYCGATVEGESTILTLGHVIPYSRGGTNEPEKLLTACKRCNSSRGDRALSVFVDAVAEYTGQDADEITKRIRRHRRRQIDVLAAKKKKTHGKEGMMYIPDPTEIMDAMMEASMDRVKTVDGVECYPCDFCGKLVPLDDVVCLDPLGISGGICGDCEMKERA